MLSELCQTERQILYITYMWNLKTNKNCKKNMLIYTENIFVVVRELSRGDEIGDRVLEKEPNGNSSVAKYNK